MLYVFGVVVLDASDLDSPLLISWRHWMADEMSTVNLSITHFINESMVFVLQYYSVTNSITWDYCMEVYNTMYLVMHPICFSQVSCKWALLCFAFHIIRCQYRRNVTSYRPNDLLKFVIPLLHAKTALQRYTLFIYSVSRISDGWCLLFICTQCEQIGQYILKTNTRLALPSV